MKNADYSSDRRKIIDFDEYKVSFKLKEYKHLIKVHQLSSNPVYFKFAKTRFSLYNWIHFQNLEIGNDFDNAAEGTAGTVTKYKNRDSVFGFVCIVSFQEYTITK